MSNYYTILGVSEKATDEEIKQAYRMLAKRYHPDLHPGDAEAAKRFALVNEANEAIGGTAAGGCARRGGECGGDPFRRR